MATKSRCLIVGSYGGSHIGSSLVRACNDLGIPADFCDVDGAWRLGTIPQKVYWHFLGKRPFRLQQFGETVVDACARFAADVVITTGPAPLSRSAIEQCQKHGSLCVNFSTDDPFYARMRMAWFIRALPAYDIVFTPRRANMPDLRNHECRRVEYLPFGYDPHLFFPPEKVNESDASDLFFAGTADEGRRPYVGAAINAGLAVRLHGQYWDRYPEVKTAARGTADLATLRQGIAATRIALCVIRHENRDGHSMRTFEVPAVGACMVVEDTAEHREIFGDDGENVLYFTGPNQMVEKAKYLLTVPAERKRLRRNAHRLITTGRNTYADRLQTMLQQCEADGTTKSQ